jgi:hypothetical protein
MNEAQTQHYTGKQVSDEDRLLDVLKKMCLMKMKLY